ncbi:MAG TPA: hypothetical protein VLD58_12375, partial [Gemmatimonadales bacterium]|nr:hypothetical protein [Gemmatimonadales bacterium]
AEDALGLTGTTYTGALAERAKLAVARQVNRIVAEPGDPFLLSHTRGAESKTWDSRAAATAKTVPLDPYAILIVEALAREAAGEDEGSYLLVPTLRWR